MDAKDKMLQELENLITKGEDIKEKMTTALSCKASFYGWKSEILNWLQFLNLKESPFYKNINNYEHFPQLAHSLKPENVHFILSQLQSLHSQIEKDLIPVGEVNTKSSLSDLENIFDKFHCIAIQMGRRHDNRATLTIKDEYDVQDLLHALLLLHFDDVRAEEWGPSHAGSCKRMDFLLKDLQTVIEVKATTARKNITDKQLGEELIVDIDSYKEHPGCKFLYCFVYDPDRCLKNPAAIKNDLEKAHDGFVKIFIRPNL